MDGSLLYALNDKGEKLFFEVSETKYSVFLTLRKELFDFSGRLVILPGLGRAKAGDPGFFVVPRNVDMSGDQLILFNKKPDAVFETRHALLNALFVNSPSFCGMIVPERNYHFSLVAEVKGGLYSCRFELDLTKNDRAYDDIRVRIIPMEPSATYGEMASRFRDLMLSEGEFVSLEDKCRRDCADYARRYPLVRIRMGWKQSPSPVLHQNDQNEPEMKVACTFKRVRELADELKKRGVEGVELQLVGWNASGHDGRFPQLFPVDERLGGEAELKETFRYVKSLGYRISLHTNLIDMTEVADGFTWEDASLGRDGLPMQIGHYSGGLAYRVCMRRQLKNAYLRFPRVAALGADGLHFLDVISIVEPDVCFDPAHPVSTKDGVELAREIMSYIKRLFGGFSSEGCFDFSMRYLDFGLYVCFGDGFKKLPVPTADGLIPFYELLIHGVALYNPASTTVNYPVKTPSDRLAFYMRGGRPALYIYSRFRTGKTNWMGEKDLVVDTDADLGHTADVIADACREYAPFADRQLVFMNDYRVLDNGIHAAYYADGAVMAGNFTDEPQSFDGHTVAPRDFILIKG